MKILAIDDQKLVLLPLEKKLTTLGYKLKTATTALDGIALFKKFNPDLIIVDLKMPYYSGWEVIKVVRNFHKSTIPIIVLTGITDDKSILKGFELGINQYLKKPVSLIEICSRVKSLLKPGISKVPLPKTTDTFIIQKKCVGIVIPINQINHKFNLKALTTFIDCNSGYHLSFVMNETNIELYKTLEKIRAGREEFISNVKCKNQLAKSELLRFGILEISKNEQLDYIGYMDAEFHNNLPEYHDLLTEIEANNYKIVNGSRITRMGAKINSNQLSNIKHYLLNFLNQKVLGMHFYDSLCNFRIMDKELIPIVFHYKFLTNRLHDLEIFIRIKNFYGKSNIKNYVNELPLKNWKSTDLKSLKRPKTFSLILEYLKIIRSYYFVKRLPKRVYELPYDIVPPKF